MRGLDLDWGLIAPKFFMSHISFYLETLNIQSNKSHSIKMLSTGRDTDEIELFTLDTLQPI